MKALTLRPHWAWFVVNGYKGIENRSWPTKLRGRIFVHSGTSPVTAREYDRFQKICGYRRIKNYPKQDEFNLGGIIGSVEIADCVTASRSFWFRGEHGFVLRNAKPEKFRPMKGKLGFFQVTSPQRSVLSAARNPVSDYVAYHSTALMGHEFGSEGTSGIFQFSSGKTRTYLEKSIGSRVWVITGDRNEERKMVYRLAAVYTPDTIREYGDRFVILGKLGKAFRKPVELNNLPWFAALYREQNKFSFGFSRIQSDSVTAGLHKVEVKK